MRRKCLKANTVCIPTALFAISVGNIIFAFTLTFTWGQNTISGKKKEKETTGMYTQDSI